MAEEHLSSVPATALAASLGVPPPADHGAGSSLPLLWHWLYLLDRPATDELAADGHRRRGAEGEDGLTARMFAGGRVHVVAPLVTGRVARVAESVVGDRTKQGSDGPLRFVTTRYTYVQDEQVRLIDERDVVYKQPSRSRTTPGATSDLAPSADEVGRVELDTTPMLLFRMSALTFNSHRIHYDRDYARDIEGYPGLVVHGPLQALAMAEAARGAVDREESIHFEYRLVAPLYEGQGLVATADRSADGSLQTLVRDGQGRRTAVGSIIIG